MGISEPNIAKVAMVVLKHGKQFWIHQRQANKHVYPALWGIGIGGKVDPGESPLQAAIRELFEESGIQAHQNSLEPLGEFNWNDPQTNYHGYVYLLEIEPDQITACTREFQDHQWTDSTGIEAKKMSGLLCPDTAYFWTTILSPSLSSPRE